MNELPPIVLAKTLNELTDVLAQLSVKQRDRLANVDRKVIKQQGHRIRLMHDDTEVIGVTLDVACPKYYDQVIDLLQQLTSLVKLPNSSNAHPLPVHREQQ